MTGADTPAAEPAAKVPPDRLALRVRPRPVVRMSRKMIALAIGFIAVAFAGAAIWSLSRALPARDQTELYAVDRVDKPDALATLPKDYRAPDGVPQLGPPLPGDLGKPILSAQADGRMAPDPHGDGDRQVRAEEARRQREAIRRSDILFQRAGAASVTPAASSPLPTAEIVPVPPPPAAGAQAAKRAFLADAAEKRIYASADIQTPASPYQLMAGSVIPAALVTGISSDLPGTVIAVVTAPVHDSVSGRAILIPQGAKLIGRYDSAVGYAQSRLLLRWERLIFPDGRSILLDNLPGADAGGQAGLEDRTDHHVDRLIGGAVLATVLGVGTSYGSSSVDADRSLVIATGDSAQGAVAQIGSEITRKNLDVQPTLTIRPGFPLKILVEKDIILPPLAG